MSFITGRTDSISNASFSRLKWQLSALSMTLSSGFVAVLEMFV